ncbi:MAG: hypothetical protein ACLFSI_02255 [Halorhodospira sp.]
MWRARLLILLGSLWAAVQLAGCTAGEGVDQLAVDYCAYMQEAGEMTIEEQQERITALDERYLAADVRESAMRSAIQRECPRVVAEHDVRLMGVLGDSLEEMRKELQELR